MSDTPQSNQPENKDKPEVHHAPAIKTEPVADKPTINRVNTTTVVTSAPAVQSATEAASKVNPAAAVVPTPPVVAPVGTPSTSPQRPVVAGSPASKPGAQPPNPAAKKRAILGCLGAFGGLMLIFLILAFIFLAQTGQGSSPIARLLGINEGVFVNGLITFVHIIFITVSLVAFVFTMVGLFKASMAQKGDKETRKAGLKSSLIAGICLFFILITWGFAYVYLDSKRVAVSPQFTQPIITTPANTLGLTGPIEIKFDASNIPIDRTRFSIVSHDWDFGDKSTGSGQIVAHTYKDKGTFDVKLIVSVKNKTTGEVSNGAEYHVTVSVENQSLSSIFKADPQSGEAPLEVSFDASQSVNPDGEIAKYEWDLKGDGLFADGTDKIFKHTFDKIGKYKVSLRVSSSTGQYDVSDQEIDVVEQQTPVAVINVVGDPKTFTINQSYVFNADASTSPNGNINKYAWVFSDKPNKTETTKTVSHIFTATGTQEITLDITDEKGKTAEIKKDIIVDAPKGTPKAKINSDPAFDAKTGILSGKAPFTVSFDAKGTTDSDNNIVDYKWDFVGDGKFDSFGDTVSHTFVQGGTYNVTLNVIDADKNIGTATLVVKVEAQGIVPVISANKVEGSIPLSVDFDASGSSYSDGQISAYKWDFGDGTPEKSGTAKISHKYVTTGTFNPTVTVVGADGKSATKSISINVLEIPLSSCFVSVFEKGPAPLQTSFDPGCSTGTAVSYSWDFGDGTTSSQAKPSHTFEKAGVYKVTLEISDAQNTVSKSEVDITVTAN